MSHSCWHGGACYILTERASGDIAGFYTLSAASIDQKDLPNETTKKLARYKIIPAVNLGRLAIDLRFRGRKLGSTLVSNAVKRTAQSEIAVFAMIVDAKDAAAEAFYLHHNFLHCGSVPGKMMASIATLLDR